MRLIIILFWSTIGFGSVEADQSRPMPQDDEMTQQDYDVALELGEDLADIRRARKAIKRNFAAQPHRDRVLATLSDRIPFAGMTDKSLSALVDKANVVLIKFGHPKEAATIKAEYQASYKNSVTNYALGIKDLGDHPPLSQWLKILHEKIEALIGPFFCKFFHLHDIYLFNYEVPVVFNPKGYLLREYLLHATGRWQILWLWDYHGLAGVTTYWVVNSACSFGTSGMGAITYVCGAVSDFASHVVDKDLAPPIAEKIWKRYNPSSGKD